MKKIEVQKTPPQPAQMKIVTHLNGQELVAYLTEAGTVCLLHRITKDYKDPERFGFFNLAYSDQSSPTFAGSSWFDAVRKAAASRELFAFDNYKDLLTWLTNGHKPFTSSTSEHTVNVEKAKEEYKQWSEDPKTIVTKQLISVLSREEVDWNGAGQVNHTHRSMTAMYRKINELVHCLNIAYHRNKSRIFAMAYGGTPPNDSHFEREEKEETIHYQSETIIQVAKPENTLAIDRNDFQNILAHACDLPHVQDKYYNKMNSKITFIRLK